MRLLPFILMIVLLNGCIIFPGGLVYFDPHTTTRSSPVGGTVLDERTHAPIAGAEIFLTEHPEVVCKSDCSGHFKLKKVLNWHWATSGTPAGSSDVPRGDSWDTIITISHTNYILRREIDWFRRCDDVILLKRLDEPSEPHPWLIFNGNGEILRDMGAGQYLKPGDIRITGHFNEQTDPAPSRIHIGFVQRVYDPQVTPVNNFDQVRFGVFEHKELDWEFCVVGVLGMPRAHHVKDLLRMYKLEFIP